MPADTPAPDPVEALLREVDFAGEHLSFVYLVAIAPRLAAIVRSLTQSVRGIEEAAAKVPPDSAHYAVMRSIVGFARAALSSAREIAEGR